MAYTSGDEKQCRIEGCFASVQPGKVFCHAHLHGKIYKKLLIFLRKDG